jgi:hypothetical protein
MTNENQGEGTLSAAYDLARLIIDFVGTLRVGGDVESQMKRLQEIAELKKTKQRLNAEIEQELNILKIKFNEELVRVREKETRDTRDYKEFLDSIDEMKIKIIQTFPDMPKPTAYVIHHHAKQLLDEIWRNSDERTRQIDCVKLADFLAVVYDDTTQLMLGESTVKFPKKTIEFIRNEHK